MYVYRVVRACVCVRRSVQKRACRNKCDVLIWVRCNLSTTLILIGSSTASATSVLPLRRNRTRYTDSLTKKTYHLALLAPQQLFAELGRILYILVAEY